MTKSFSNESPQTNIHRIASCYFAIQSLLGLAWWIGIKANHSFAELFFSADTVATNITTFAIADLSCFVGLSVLAAIATARGMGIAYPVVMGLLGAVAYATLCCVGLVSNGGPWFALAQYRWTPAFG